MRVEVSSRSSRELEASDDLAISVDLENPARNRVALVDEMIRRDEEAERMANVRPFFEEAAPRVENLDPPFSPSPSNTSSLCDANQALSIRTRAL